jgi:glycosyltransferase involved in cell wall biosynthesis
MTLPTCSLCISTYNWPDALQLCLQSVLRQRILPQQLVIADDGSRADTKAVIDTFKKTAPMPVEHVWQPDEGYQLARIRNRAFAKSTGDYIVQVDGDLLLHPYFIEDHLRFARKNFFVSGSRVMLAEGLTKEFLTTGHFFYPGFANRQITKRYNALHNRLVSWMNGRWQAGNYKYVLGCNMAFWKNDLISVNGYDEAFSGWGKEDNDIAVRLQNAGKKLRFLKFGGMVYHLHHKISDGHRLGINEKLLEESIAQKKVAVQKGMNQYTSPE